MSVTHAHACQAILACNIWQAKFFSYISHECHLLKMTQTPTEKLDLCLRERHSVLSPNNALMQKYEKIREQTLKPCGKSTSAPSPKFDHIFPIFKGNCLAQEGTQNSAKFYFTSYAPVSKDGGDIMLNCCYATALFHQLYSTLSQYWITWAARWKQLAQHSTAMLSYSFCSDSPTWEMSGYASPTGLFLACQPIFQ